MSNPEDRDDTWSRSHGNSTIHMPLPMFKSDRVMGVYFQTLIADSSRCLETYRNSYGNVHDSELLMD